MEELKKLLAPATKSDRYVDVWINTKKPTQIALDAIRVGENRTSDKWVLGTMLPLSIFESPLTEDHFELILKDIPEVSGKSVEKVRKLYKSGLLPKPLLKKIGDRIEDLACDIANRFVQGCLETLPELVDKAISDYWDGQQDEEPIESP